MDIGIDVDRNLLYEGRGYWGHPVWPTPVLTPAKFVFGSETALIAESRTDLVGDAWYFREDFYEPTSRIRRGRFYQAGNLQPQEWRVNVHPAATYEAKTAIAGVMPKRLQTFFGNSIWHRFIKGQSEQVIVLLGFAERFTIWTIVGVEAISTGEDLVTLRAHSRFGVLPTVDTEQVPESYRAALIESLNGFTDEVHRASPTSVIDRSRDVASQALLAYYNSNASDAKDLGDLTKRLEGDGKVIAASAAKIIARLHARAKPVESVRRPARAIREQDAELATQCLGALFCELGWADWM